MSKNTDTNIDSRTAAFGAEPSSDNHLYRPSPNPSKNLANSPALPSNDADGSDSDGSVFYEPGTSGPCLSSAKSPPLSPSQLPRSTSSPMARGFGTNRLAAGFGGYRAAPVDEVASSGAQDVPIDLMSSPGRSADHAIEITDDEGSESGGMLINVDNSANSHFHAPSASGSEASDSEDEGLVKSTPSDGGSGMTTRSRANLERHTSNAVLQNSNSAQSFTRLMDLPPVEQELQIRYAFYDQDQSCIDMTSPALCLTCLTAGHSRENCPERVCLHCAAVDEHTTRMCPTTLRCSRCRERGHPARTCRSNSKVASIPCDLCSNPEHGEDSCPQRFFAPSVQSLALPVKLWISCCLCASKTHLVGDCPDADQALIARWSLKHLAPTNIVNLSLEKATQQLEKQAASRGLRPDSLRIKGRAGMHQAGRYTRLDTEEDDSEDEFIRPSVAQQRPPQPRIAPVDRSGQDHRLQDGKNRRRAPSDWYSTNSFGQRRSQSPPSPESRRRMPDRRRSRSPRRFDGYNPGRRRSPSPRSDNGSRKPSPPNSRRSGPGRDNPPKRGVSTDLPVRRGSQNKIEHPLPAKPPAVMSSAITAVVEQSQKSGASSSSNDTASKKKKRTRKNAKGSAPATQKA